MAGMIPQSFINGLVERVDIADVVGARVKLRKAGGNQMGLCPFHDEKTPSFHVYPDGHYHCFGCGAHGTTVGFLMEMDGLTFPEAVESLAAFAGVEVPREQAARRSERPPTEGIYEVLAAADEHFRGWLGGHAEGAAARAYLTSRGVDSDTARQFGVGLAPSGWQTLKAALAKFGEEKLVDAGLAVKNERGRVYDRFRARVVFPIRDTRGRVIGFGGRVYDGSGAKGEGPGENEPKYLNSPETPVFHKGEELYGLFEARRTARRLDHLLVVEGYMDVVALASQGVGGAVATLGTAVGEAHFKRLFRHVNRVICCFDGDDAGRNAAWKAVDAAFPALSAGRELRFVFLPEGEDPDTLVRSRGAAHFRGLIENAVPVGNYFWDHAKAGLDLGGVGHRATLCDFALPHIALLPNGALRDLLVRDLAALVDTDAADLERRLGAPPADPPAPTFSTERDGESRAAEALLHRLVRHPSLFGGLSAAQREQLVAADGLLGEVARFLAEQPSADTAVLLGWSLGEPCHAPLAAFAARPLSAGADIPAQSVRESPSAVAVEFSEWLRRHVEVESGRRRRALFDQVRRSDSLDVLRRLRDAKAADSRTESVAPA